MERRKTSLSKKLSAFALSSLERPESVARGGKVLLPAACFKELHTARRGFEASNTCLAVRNAATKTETVLGVLECSGDDASQVFVPDWAMQQLELQPGEQVRVRLATLPSATWVQVRLGHEARGLRDIEEALVTHLRGFAALGTGDSMTVKFEGREFSLQVLQAEPRNKVRLPAGHKLDVEVVLEEAPAQPDNRRASDAPEEAPVPVKKAKTDEEPPTINPEQRQAMREARLNKFQH